MLTFIQPYILAIKAFIVVLVLATILGEYVVISHQNGTISKQSTELAQIQTLSEQQNNLAKTKDLENVQVSQTTALAYSAKISRLNNALSKSNSMPVRPRVYPLKLPKPSQSSSGVVSTEQKQSGIAECNRQFYDQALEDVIKLNALQDWITKENLR